MNTRQAQRIIIFGREGVAREQLVSALSDYGVVPVWVGNPVQSSPNELSVLNPNQIIISLDPLIEAELLPYNDFLRHSDISILYDDAESTKQLSGWDLNRWARHMASKLLDIDYMPPAPKSTNSSSEVNPSFTEMMPEFETSGVESSEENQLLDAMTISNDFKVVSSESEKSFEWQNSESFDTLDINSSDLSEALSKIDQNLSSGLDSSELQDQEYDQITPLAELDLKEFETNSSTSIVAGAEIDFNFGTMSADLSKTLDSQSENFDDINLSVDESNSTANKFELLLDESAEEPQLFNILDKEENSEEDLNYMDDEALKQAVSKLDSELFATNSSPSVLSANLDMQSLVSDSNSAMEADDDKAKPREFDLSKYSLLNEEDEEQTLALESEQANKKIKTSLFLLISGVGGPGVIRTILGQIDKDFSSIMVISQVIQAGQLLKLSQQLQKVVGVPVTILSADEFLKDGNIYLLPEKHSILQTPLGFQCITGNSMSSFIAEANPDIEFIVLSGADKSLADALIRTSAENKNVHAQSADECFEVALPQLLINAGVPVLRQYILEKWFN